MPHKRVSVIGSSLSNRVGLRLAVRRSWIMRCESRQRSIMYFLRLASRLFFCGELVVKEKILRAEETKNFEKRNQKLVAENTKSTATRVPTAWFMTYGLPVADLRDWTMKNRLQRHAYKGMFIACVSTLQVRMDYYGTMLMNTNSWTSADYLYNNFWSRAFIEQ